MSVICKNCGTKNSNTANTCLACGQKLSPCLARSDNLMSFFNPDDYKVVINQQKPQSTLPYVDFISTEATYDLALCKLNGIGGKKNISEALTLLLDIAYKGNYDAMYKLADIYLTKCPDKKEEAFAWLKVAADGGHQPSINRLKVENCEKYLATAPVNSDFQAQNNIGDDMTKLVKDALPNIITIAAYCGQSCSEGTGFIIEGGYVITNAHVVEKAAECKGCITATFDSSIDHAKYNLNLLGCFPDYDLAVLRFTGVKDSKVSKHGFLLRINDVEYEKIYTVGNALGLGLSFSSGVVSCPNRENCFKGKAKISSFIQVDISFNGGNSGGPILDSGNRVIGVATMTPADAHGGMGMCVPSKYIVEVLNKLNK